MDRINLAPLFRKYRYVLIILLIGIVLMLLPPSAQEPAQTVSEQPQPKDLEARLEQILSRIAGAGEVAVMLTETASEEVIYQTDGNGEDTVLIKDSQRNEQGLVRSRQPPSYRGAIVVCSGADNAAVKLAVVEAVSNVTGLGTDKITVLKME